MFSPSAHGGHEPVPLVGKYSRIGKRCRKSRRLNQSATIEPDKLSLDAIGRASPSERLPYLSLPYHESMM